MSTQLHLGLSALTVGLVLVLPSTALAAPAYAPEGPSTGHPDGPAVCRLLDHQPPTAPLPHIRGGAATIVVTVPATTCNS